MKKCQGIEYQMILLQSGQLMSSCMGCMHGLHAHPCESSALIKYKSNVDLRASLDSHLLCKMAMLSVIVVVSTDSDLQSSKHFNIRVFSYFVHNHSI